MVFEKMVKCAPAFALSAFLFIGLVTQLNGQNYSAILEADKCFTQLSMICDVGGGVKAKVGGDTVINDINYKKIYSISCKQEPQIYCYARTDEQNSVLWMTYDGNEEYRLMDLNLKVGDIFSNIYEDFEVLKVEIKDRRKWISLSGEVGACGSAKFHFIEGIGSTAGFNSNNIGFMLDCVTLNDSVHFKNEDSYRMEACNDDCLDTYVGVKSELNSIHPFSAKLSGAELLVESNVPELELSIYDLMGRFVSSNTLSKDIPSLITLDKLNSSFFIVCGSTKENKLLDCQKMLWE